MCLLRTRGVFFFFGRGSVGFFSLSQLRKVLKRNPSCGFVFISEEVAAFGLHVVGLLDRTCVWARRGGCCYCCGFLLCELRKRKDGRRRG